LSTFFASIIIVIIIIIIIIIIMAPITNRTQAPNNKKELAE